MRVREDYQTLTGPEKAAILMLSVGEDHASRLFALMDDEEIRELSQTMSDLGTVHSSVIERLFVEFAAQISPSGSRAGISDAAERLLGKDRADGIVDKPRDSAGHAMWDKLATMDEGVLAERLRNESPPTVAVVLARTTPEHGARVLSRLPEAFALDVVMHMQRMGSVEKEVLDDVEHAPRSEFMTSLARTTRRDSAERIKAMTITFEDLGRLAPGSVQTLLRNIDRSKLAVALKGASEPLRGLFLANLSERTGRLLREEILALGPLKLRDVDEAQMYMVALAKELEAKGEIVIATEPVGDDEFIY